MNVNETYINMCKKANELWDGRRFEIGDCVVAKYTEDGLKDGFYVAGYDDLDALDHVIFGGRWFAVFRQFQLQRMVKLDNESWLALDTRFNTFTPDIPSYEVWTPEQRWLAFVMKEKFNKFWDGKDWIRPK
jgi:hypothetical protein